MKKLVAMLMALMLCVGLLPMTALAADNANAAPSGYTYLYDCQRSPGDFPSSTTNSITLSGFATPLAAPNGSATLNSSGWSVEYMGTYGDLSSTDREYVDETIGLMNSANGGALNIAAVPIYKMKNGENIIRAVLVAKSSAGWLLVRDNIGTESFSNGVGYFLTSAEPNGNVTFTVDVVPGKDTNEYTITFDLQGGTGDVVVKSTESGKLDAMPADPTREGYAFVGWFDAATGGTEVTTGTVFSAATTVYAQWTAEEPTPDPEPEVKPEPCDHKLDENGKCSRCGIIIISYVDGEASVEDETEANPNTGAPAPIAAFAAMAVLSVAAFAGKKK